MAKIVDTKEIPLQDLEIGKGQSRVRDVGKDISELGDSIRRIGQLEPIVVCPGSKAGKYEILTGQRRFLACKEIGAKTIWAVITDEKVDEITAKVISVTENLMRRDLNKKDLIDVCTALYKHYGTVQDVCQETGLPPSQVRLYVKYERLISELKDAVDKGEVDLKAALRTQDAFVAGGELVAEEALTLAKEMSGMSGVQQQKVVDELTKTPEKQVDDVIEEAKTGAKITQIIVTLSAKVHESLQTYASEEGTTQDDAAASLIQESLAGKGYIGE